MIVLYCEECNEAITEDNGGIKYNGLYFCSRECFDDYINWYIDPIAGEDFERKGVEIETDNTDEIVND